MIAKSNDMIWKSVEKSERWVRETERGMTRILFRNGVGELFSISYGTDGRDFTVASGITVIHAVGGGYFLLSRSS